MEYVNQYWKERGDRYVQVRNLADLERARPVLEVLGSAIHHFGAVGAGQQVKAINQVLVAGSYAAVAEAGLEVDAEVVGVDVGLRV